MVVDDGVSRNQAQRKHHSLPRPVKYQGGGVRTSVWPISRGESIFFSSIPNFSPSFQRCLGKRALKFSWRERENDLLLVAGDSDLEGLPGVQRWSLTKQSCDVGGFASID